MILFQTCLQIQFQPGGDVRTVFMAGGTGLSGRRLKQNKDGNVIFLIYWLDITEERRMKDLYHARMLVLPI